MLYKIQRGDIHERQTILWSFTNAMPGGVVLLVELFLYVSSDILLDTVLAKCLSSDIHSILLHVVAHIGVLHDGSSHLRHGGRGYGGKALQGLGGSLNFDIDRFSKTGNLAKHKQENKKREKRTNTEEKKKERTVDLGS